MNLKMSKFSLKQKTNADIATVELIDLRLKHMAYMYIIIEFHSVTLALYTMVSNYL